MLGTLASSQTGSGLDDDFMGLLVSSRFLMFV